VAPGAAFSRTGGGGKESRLTMEKAAMQAAFVFSANHGVNFSLNYLPKA
jgi:hypothetical protein